MSASGRKKILIVHHGAGIGGAPKSMSYIARILAEEGHAVEILFLKKSSAIDLVDDINCKIHISKLPIYYFYHMSKWIRIKYFYKAIVQIISLIVQTFIVAPYYIVKIKPDIIYINTSVLPEWTIISRIFRKRIVVHIRETTSNGYVGFRRSILKFIYSIFPSHVISISKANLKALGLTPSQNTSVIYNYERLKVSKKCASVKKYDFLYLGGESGIKGWDFIMRLLLTDLNFKIAIAGAFNKNTIDILLKDVRVNYLGVIKDVPDIMSKSYYLLSPFKEAHFSRPIIEAYAYGCIPISSNLEGIEEQLKDRKTGLLFDVDEFSDFLKIIQYALSLEDTDKMDEILTFGMTLFEESFSIANEAKIVNKIINY